MRVPVSWLRELVDLPTELSGRQIADRLINAGLEVETVDQVGVDLSGPLVIGRVIDFVEEEHSNGKTVRWCRVDVGTEHNEPGSRASRMVGESSAERATSLLKTSSSSPSPGPRSPAGSTSPRARRTDMSPTA